ncbi:hypothetical protein WMC59_12115 [Staphylococcus delphini]|uniref:hypothetical protein n=1 Tax=Staphylococcus delphini TaxID=53344 RepID=UPI00374F7BA8
MGLLKRDVQYKKNYFKHMWNWEEKIFMKYMEKQIFDKKIHCGCSSIPIGASLILGINVNEAKSEGVFKINSEKGNEDTKEVTSEGTINLYKI